MKIQSWWIKCLCAVWATVVSCQILLAEQAHVLTAEGYGPVKIGMSLVEASQALGVTLKPSYDEDLDSDCFHIRPEAGPMELNLMMINGKLSRISIYNSPSTITTDKGIRIGDKVEQVLAQYGESIENEEHEYMGPAGRYLTWWNATRTGGVRYETSPEGEVTTIHAGNESISLVEGCS